MSDKRRESIMATIPKQPDQLHRHQIDRWRFGELIKTTDKVNKPDKELSMALNKY